MTYKILEQNLEALTKRLTNLNKKLIAIGVPQVSFTTTGHEDTPDDENPAKLIRRILIDVEGTAPEYNGWTFLATIDHTPEGNVIRTVPGFDVPVNYREGAPCCDHCKMNRMRRDTYIVRHEDGRTMQVGSSCLQDFLAYENPTKLTKATQIILSAFDIVEAAQDEQWLGGNGKSTLHYARISLRAYLAQVAAVARADRRFITSSRAKQTDSVSTARTALHLLDNGFVANLQAAYVPTDADKAQAEEAINWVVGKYGPVLGIETGSADDFKEAVFGTLRGTNAEISEFEHNMLTVARAEAIERRLCGIAAYIIEAHRRATEVRKQAPQLDASGLNRIFAMFGEAEKHLKHPAIRLTDNAGRYMVLSLASPTSKNPGCIYVKGERGTGAYFGKITPQGRFYQAGGCPNTVEPQLLALAQNPEEIAARYGKMTGRCCFCGRALTDHRSTDVGYGPVCAERFGLEWGKHSEAPEQQVVTTA